MITNQTNTRSLSPHLLLYLILMLVMLVTPNMIHASDGEITAAQTSNENNDEEADTRIVNGTIVNPAPSWIASGIVNGGAVCTGTLIYSQWVLSAGHCGNFDGVRIAGTNANNGTYIPVQQSFILDSNGGNRDLALHKLSIPVSNQPMELNRNTNLLSQNPWVIAFGYGAQNASGANDTLLRQTPWLNVYTRDGYGSAFEFGRSSNSGTCFGDSGGPIMGNSSNGQGIFILAGVNSYTNPVNGVSCVNESGGADVSENIGWIDSIINANGGSVGVQNPAVMLSPTLGSSLDCGSATFTWSNEGASQYWLYVGTPQNETQYYSANQGANTSATVSGLPQDGSTVRVRLWTLHASTGWTSNVYDYPSCQSSSGTQNPAMMLTTTPLSCGAATLTWSNEGAEQYWLYVGTPQNETQYYADSQGTNTSITLSGLPQDGSTLYIRIWTYHSSTGWLSITYSYSACGGRSSSKGMEITSPAQRLNDPVADPENISPKGGKTEVSKDMKSSGSVRSVDNHAATTEPEGSVPTTVELNSIQSSTSRSRGFELATLTLFLMIVTYASQTQHNRTRIIDTSLQKSE